MVVNSGLTVGLAQVSSSNKIESVTDQLLTRFFLANISSKFANRSSENEDREKSRSKRQRKKQKLTFSIIMTSSVFYEQCPLPNRITFGNLKETKVSIKRTRCSITGYYDIIRLAISDYNKRLILLSMI